jgi:hypothetical protein
LKNSVEERKNAMAKLPKSRYCKVDAVNCKGFAQRWFVWYWCVQIFWPRRVAIYVLRTTWLLADYGTVYLHLKNQTLPKNRKWLLQESNSPKTDSDLLPIVEWPTSTTSCLFWCASWLSPSSSPSADPSDWPSADWVGRLVYRCWAALTIGELRCPAPVGWLHYSSIGYFSLSDFVSFFQNMVSTAPGYEDHRYPQILAGCTEFTKRVVDSAMKT